MFKRIKIMTAVLLVSSPAAFSQMTHVSVEVPGWPDTMAVVHYYKDTAAMTDTIAVKGGKCAWTGNMPEPQRIYIEFNMASILMFFAESGEIQITCNADLTDPVVKGSKSNDEWTAYVNSLKDLSEQEEQVRARLSTTRGTEEHTGLLLQLEGLRAQRAGRGNDYIAAHPMSPLSIDLVSQRTAMGEYTKVNTAYELLSPSARQSAAGRRIAAKLVVLKRSGIGTKIPDFVQTNTEGSQVRFSSFKGKYVLVDFWASWCSPCRAENPNLLKAYEKYKTKNFTIVAISLDQKVDAWKKAIKEDKMPWTHLSDLKGFDNAISKYYGIQGIPSNILVGPNGKVIAKNLRGPLLQNKLAELLD